MDHRNSEAHDMVAQKGHPTHDPRTRVHHSLPRHVGDLVGQLVELEIPRPQFAPATFVPSSRRSDQRRVLGAMLQGGRLRAVCATGAQAR